MQAPLSASKPANLPPQTPQWLQTRDWLAAFPQHSHWFSYGQTLPTALIESLCAAKLGQAPRRALVEHPWQAQWLLRQCAAYLKGLNHAAPLPQVQTLGQCLNAGLSGNAELNGNDGLNSGSNLGDGGQISPQQAALQLTQALQALQVQAIHSDRARYGLATEMVKLMAEMALRAQLSPAIAQAGQDAAQRLAQPVWLSREAHWLHLAQASLHTAAQDTGQRLLWQAHVSQLAPVAADDLLVLVLPSPHPSVLMQAFLSQSLNPACAVGLPQLADSAEPLNTQSDHQTHVTVTPCDSFEHEASTAAALIARLLTPTLSADMPAALTKSVIVVAHDRVLARRVAALLARRGLAVEDRVGWALSTTVAATVVRGLLSSWQGSDVPALMTWLALPMVARHWPDAPQTLAFLRKRWHAQTIAPDGRVFIQRAMAQAQALEQASILACLQHWQSAQHAFTHVARWRSVAAFALAVLTFLAPLAGAMQADAAGGKVWQQLLGLAAAGGAQAHTAVSFATFVAVLDEALESERFSASNANHAEHTVRAVFAPFYEAAWLEETDIVMLGCNEAHLPAQPINPTPLLASVRRELGLPQPGVERAVWQHLLAQRSKRIHATFTPSETGNPSRISPYLLAFAMQIAPPTCEDVTANSDCDSGVDGCGDIGNDIGCDIETTQLQTAKQGFENQPPENLAIASLRLQAMPTEISVTQLAQIVQCPYRFALNSVFGIRPLAEPKLWPSHLERGNLLHDALHAVFADPQGSLQALNAPAVLRSAIHTALHAQLPSKLPLSGRYAALVADSQRTVDTYVAAHSARQAEGWRIHAAEHTVESKAIVDGVRVHGKLDRIDAIRGNTQTIQGFAVLDYKTSTQKVLVEKRDNPLQDAQLALYTALLEANEQPTAQAAYWRLHDGLYDGLYDGNGDVPLPVDSPTNPASVVASVQYHAKQSFFELTDLPNQTEAITASVRLAWLKAAVSHSAPATPNALACEYCAYKGICRSSGLTFSEAQVGTQPENDGDADE